MNTAAPSQIVRARAVNVGDRTQLRGSQRQTLAWMNIEASRAFTVYAEARLTLPPAFLGRVVPMVHLEWGHGGAAIAAEFPIVDRLRVPLAASMIKLEGRLLDTSTGAAPPSEVLAEITAFIAAGTDGETIHSAQTVVVQGNGGMLAESGRRLLAVQGHSGGVGGVWLMLFDARQVPADGAVPHLALPAPGILGGAFARELRAPRDFHHGVSWAASSTPLTLTRAAGAALHLEVDFLL